jgi:hypothetical protein
MLIGGINIKETNVPKTVLDDIWADVILKLKSNPEFDSETVENLISIVKSKPINPDQIIDLFND